jgi:hypothetical protein
MCGALSMFASVNANYDAFCPGIIQSHASIVGAPTLTC